uniref:Secreted protein n=1 Tax=Haemonchus contortus TaxID=6289 RepID=A0A7I4YR82_HAECO
YIQVSSSLCSDRNLTIMHLQIIFVACCAFLFAQGSTKERNCRKDVPTNVQQILIEVVNKKCKDITKNGGNFTPLSDDKYDCELGQKAFGRGPSDGTDLGLLTFFDGKSNFEFDWEKSLTAAVNFAEDKNTAYMSWIYVVTMDCTAPPELEIMSNIITGVPEHRSSVGINIKKQ